LDLQRLCFAPVKALANQFVVIIDEMFDYDCAREVALKD